MKTRKKYVNVFIITIVVLSVMGTALALTSYEEEVSSQITDFIPKIKYLIEKGLILFTSWGEANDCSTYPDKEKWIEKNERIDCDDYCSYDKCAIDIWYDNTIYLGSSTGPPNSVNWNNWLKEEAGDREYFVGTTYPWYYVQVYCCPELYVVEDHDTKAYVCEDGDWDYKGTYDIDEYCKWDTSGVDLCWCNDEDEDFYVDESGAVHCRSSPYSSWCTVPVADCTSGQTKCVGTTYYSCVNENWVSQGQVDGLCGYDEGNGEGNGDVPINLDAIIYDINVQSSVKPGEEVVVEFKVKNSGDTGDYLIETGIIPKSTAEEWGFKYAGMGFGIFDWLTQKNLECCEGQPNIFAKTTKLSSGEIDTFKIKIPNAPYSEIKDLCYDNTYWDGEGEYVLYIIVKTDCWPEGKEVTYETKIINLDIGYIGNGNDNGEVGLSKTLTWSEYYSIDDEKLAEGIFRGSNYICSLDSDCELKTDYDVYCNSDDEVQDRLYDGIQDKCDDYLQGTGLIGKLVSKTIKILINPCEAAVSRLESIASVFNVKPGVCIAESTTWYGRAWDKTLQTVGGLGLPAQYVFIITVILLITLLGIIIKFATGK